MVLYIMTGHPMKTVWLCLKIVFNRSLTSSQFFECCMPIRSSNNWIPFRVMVEHEYQAVNYKKYLLQFGKPWCKYDGKLLSGSWLTHLLQLCTFLLYHYRLGERFRASTHSILLGLVNILYCMVHCKAPFSSQNSNAWSTEGCSLN